MIDRLSKPPSKLQHGPDNAIRSGGHAGIAFAGLIAVAAWPAVATAQVVELPFPTGMAGYDQQLGVTVQSRARPGYDPPGIHAGAFTIRPALDQSLGYNSNPTGTSLGGSPYSQTTGSLAAASQWSRNSLAAAIGVSNTVFFSIPGLEYTDWNVGLRGGYTIGRNDLTAAYSHQTVHELGTTLGATRSVTPALDQVDTARLQYTFAFNRLSLTPDLDASAYHFGPATIGGVSIDQSFLDRDVFSAGLTARYEVSESGSLVGILRGVESNFARSLPGQPSNSSTSVLLLGGVDVQPGGPLRYQFLAGLELRSFAASQFATQITPTIESRVIWTPIGVLTLTGGLSRAIQDPEAAGTNGFVLTRLNVTADYELRRDILLNARGTIQEGEFFQQGTQTSFTVGAGATWLINRNLRASFDVAYTRQSGANGSNTAASLDTVRSGAFSQTVAGVTLHFAL